MNNEKILEELYQIKERYQDLNKELSKKVAGYENIIRQLFICLMCKGHALIEGVPGVGKTHLIKSLSEVLDLFYSRIQFTPDMMPADIIGTNIVAEGKDGHRQFEFYKGPIFGQIVLADEINRATPKTQSALLEAMQENCVTVFGTSYVLDPPFMVLATQNPIEMEGTYPLPEAQVDRFLFKLKIPFPTADQLKEIIDKTTGEEAQMVEKVFTRDEILGLQPLVKQVLIADHVKDYAIRLVLATHPAEAGSVDLARSYVRYGAGPRAVQSLVMAAKVVALLNERVNVSFDDIKEIAIPALRHRLILNLKGEAEGIEVDDIIRTVLGSTRELVK